MREIVSYDYISMTIIDHDHDESCRTYTQSNPVREQITTETLKNNIVRISNTLGKPEIFSHS